ncbi:MAG: PIN domain-containing protein [Kiritimatiellae bacterium]|nr:PIN domain-containing protein [Kiritimatiellia bacterium]
MKFIDTSVLVYVADDADAAKQSVSRGIVREALTTNAHLISAQVLNEFSSVLFRKLKKTAQEVDGFLDVIERINTVAVKPEWTRMAIGLMSRYGIQFFDSLLLVAARENGCDEILTEDLNDGQMYGSVKAVNPFKGL